jgi:feruloyl esterase
MSAYGSVDATTRTAKFLIDAFYGRQANKSYFVGCSTGGRQGMMFSQNFPDYYDGIVAGDPVYDLESIALSEVYGVEAMAAITPAPIAKLANGSPILYPAFPEADQKLFTSALLSACDKLDGTADGVIDDLPACRAKFDPATFVFPDSGKPLRCTGTKNATCLSPEQIGAIKKINQGPRNSLGEAIGHRQVLRSVTASTQRRSATLTMVVSWRQPASRRAKSAQRPQHRAISR